MAENTTTTPRHLREVTGHDGVSDDTAIRWSDAQDARVKWGATGVHHRNG